MCILSPLDRFVAFDIAIIDGNVRNSKQLKVYLQGDLLVTHQI